MPNFITVLLPAYNEADRIKNTISSLQKSVYVTKIVVIDDGSKDQTSVVAQQAGAEVYTLPKNFGKGYALTFGIEKVIEVSDIIVFLDADIGDTAIEVDKLLVPVVTNQAEVAIAKFPSAKKKGGFGLVKNLAKYGVKFYTGHIIHTSLSGQRAFKVSVLKKINNFPSDYGIEVGMTIDILRLGFSIREVEVNMSHRETGRDIQGFKHRGKQFYQILRTLIRKSKGEKK